MRVSFKSSEAAVPTYFRVIGALTGPRGRRRPVVVVTSVVLLSLPVDVLEHERAHNLTTRAA